jgi:RNA polymerase sigma-B factor
MKQDEPVTETLPASAANRFLTDSQARALITASHRGAGVARTRLVECYVPLVKTIARRFSNRGEHLEDLVQVGTLGLIAAIDRFDLDRDVEFLAFAIPTITGEIKRHLRDHASPIRVPRRVHELAPSVRRRELELSALLKRPASPAELALDLGVPETDVEEVLAARRAHMPLSLGDSSVHEARVAGDDQSGDVYAAIDDRLVVAAGLRGLTRRDRCILRLRFVDELTQAEIAARLDISQVHVSRLLRSALATLRRELVDDAQEPLVRGAAQRVGG